MRGGQRMISPRSTVRTHRLGEVVDRHIFGEEPVEHRAEKEDAAALEGLARSRSTVISIPRAAPTPLSWRNAAHDRRLSRLRTPRILPSVALSERSANERSSLAQRLPPSSGAAVDQAEMIEAQKVDQPPGDRAGMASVSCRLRAQPDHRLARAVGPADALHIELDVVEEAEVGAALAHRQLLGQMPVGAERADAKLGDRAPSSLARRRLGQRR